MSVCFECYMLSEVSATGRSLVEGSPIECGVSECNLETPTMRRPWPTGPVEPYESRNTAQGYTVLFLSQY